MSTNPFLIHFNLFKFCCPTSLSLSLSLSISRHLCSERHLCSHKWGYPKPRHYVHDSENPETQRDFPFITATPIIHKKANNTSEKPPPTNHAIKTPWQHYNPPLPISTATHSLEPKNQEITPNSSTKPTTNPKSHNTL
jgi:hypothetical protein